MSKTLKRESCTYCHSSNNVCYWEYENKEYSKCLTPDCEYNRKNTSKILTSSTDDFSPLTTGHIQELEDRKISKEICQLYNYQIGDWKGRPCHIENYYTDGKIDGQKIRLLPKTIFWNGKSKALFGEHLLPSQNQDQLTLWVTEGAIDCLSLKTVMPDEYIVSLSYGAGDQTEGEISAKLDLFDKFKQVILCFDNDSAGNHALKDCASLYGRPKFGYVQLRYKDPNLYLQEGKLDELKQDLKAWELYVPEGLRQPSLKELTVPESMGIPLQYPGLNRLIKGFKPGKLITIMAGSGAGKSTFTKELVFHIVNTTDQKCGVAYLEESQKSSAQSFIALAMNVPLHQIEENQKVLDSDEFRMAYFKYINKKIFLLNASFMKLTGDELLYNLEYMINNYGCQTLVLDHITMVTYDMQGENSERKDLDMLMKKLRALVQKTQCSIILVTHLKRPGQGKSYDEGREIHMSDGRSSGALEQLSDIMIALERNMLSDTNNKTRIKVLKNRITGLTGYCDDLLYISNTGRLVVL